MNISADTTLAEFAVRLPAASRVFRRHGLDFCCSGHRPLADACRARSIDPAVVLAELERESSLPSANEAGFADKSTDELVDFIVARYHESLRQELPELVRMAKRVEVRHGDKPECPQGLGDLLERIEAELGDHMMKEEHILFPMLKSGAGMGARGPITVMTREHDDHGENLRKIRALVTDFVPPPPACNTWRALYLRLEQLESDLMDHIHLENNVLFPRALHGG